ATHPASSSLKNVFFNELRCGRWIDRHFSNTQVFEKWSKAKIAFLLCVVEKVPDGFFQQTGSIGCYETGGRVQMPIGRGSRRSVSSSPYHGRGRRGKMPPKQAAVSVPAFRAKNCRPFVMQVTSTLHADVIECQR
ncbi:MAG TPA: hypothetical protein VGA00_02035, partial [Acidiferrobacterales bacterium]